VAHGDRAAPTGHGPCQAGNPASFPVIPTITRSVKACILADMASGSDPVSDDGGSPPSGPSVETLGITEVVITILEAQKTMPWATAAAVSRESRGDVIHVRVSLLESSPSSSSGRPQDQPGRSDVVAVFTARRLGADLAAAFGQKDVIILN
jgi:hypothetical protein